MDLILWRHAEAEDGDGALLDHERCLTPRGMKQAKLAAGWLQRHLPKARRVLASPTRRTLQTADALRHAYEIEPRLGTGASVRDALTASGWPDRNEAVIIVGHQPTMGRLAAFLLAEREEDWSFRKGAVWWFSCRERNGKSRTVLRAVFDPDFS